MSMGQQESEPTGVGPSRPSSASARATEASIPSRFAEVVATGPDAVAVAAGDERLTYAELDRRSDELAAAIVDRAGPGPEPVAVLAGHHAGSVVASLAVLKAGRPYVCLDPASPPARLAQIGSLAGPAACVADRDRLEIAASIPALGSPVPLDARGSAPFAVRRVAPGAPAAVVFTSGSTGEPKGVVIPHSMYLEQAFTLSDAVGLGADDRFGLVMPLSFAAGSGWMQRCIAIGAGVYLHDPRETGVAAMIPWLLESRITAVVATPSLLRALAEAAGEAVLPDLRLVMSVGEAARGADVLAMRPHLPPAATFVNLVSSSETFVYALFCLRGNDPVPDVLPAGRPVGDKDVSLRTPEGTPVAPGEVGEIVVTSRHLASGYWRRPDMAAERFTELADGRRSYRTGDLGRIRADGSLEYLGRSDQMVKVRGYLVEPAEVEAALVRISEVRDAAVVGRAGEDGTTRLVAYVVPEPGGRVSAPALRRALRARLPSYMVPAIVVEIAELPRNANGKVDRGALPEPPHPRPTLATAGDPSDWELAIAGLWAEILGLDSVALDDDFLDLGGDSLAAEEVLAALEADYGVSLPSSALAEAPTPRQLAYRARRPVDPAYPTLIPLQATGSGDPLFCVAGAGGLAIAFLPLARRLGGDRPVYGLQSRGLEGAGLPETTIAATARHHLHALRAVRPHGPYLLAGHSTGGLVAFELARLLRDAGEEVRLLAILDTADPRAGHSLGRLAPVSRAAALVWFGAALVFPRYRHLRYAAFYRLGGSASRIYRPRGGYAGRALVQVTRESIDAGASFDWSGLLTGPWTPVEVPGDHLSMLREPHVADVASAIARELEAPDA